MTKDTRIKKLEDTVNGWPPWRFFDGQAPLILRVREIESALGIEWEYNKTNWTPKKSKKTKVKK